jgi:predicted DNA-binding protein
MNDTSSDLTAMTPNQAANHAMDHDLGDLLADAEVVRERRPAKMVTALRIDLDIQARLEQAAAARGIGTSTLMRQIIEEWVDHYSDQPAPDHVSELVRHLDAARRAAIHLATPAA